MHNVTLSNNTIVMCASDSRLISYSPVNIIAFFLHRVWISSDDVVAVAQKGYRFVHAASDYFYLVCTWPQIFS